MDRRFVEKAETERPFRNLSLDIRILLKLILNKSEIRMMRRTVAI
jgi:hypothetical protein